MFGMLPRISGGSAPPSGIVNIRGSARINGVAATAGMAVRVGDELATAPGADITLVIGADAMLIRGNSQAHFVPVGRDGAYLLRLITGAVLAVFAPGAPRHVRTATAEIGIRGTAAYVSVEPDRTYVCICYGTARLAALGDMQAAETVTTTHHDEPRYIYRSGMPQMIGPAPVLNHTDEELEMLEGLVGRKPPFTGAY